MIRLLILAIVAAVGLTLYGGQGTYEALRNRSPHAMTLAEYNQERPTGGWVKISHCPINALDGMWSGDENGGIDTVYIPVYMDEDGTTGKHGKASLLIQSKDPAYIDMANQMKQLEDQPNSEEKVLQFIKDNRTKIFAERDVEGTIQFGLNSIKDEERQKLAGLDESLEANFVVLEEGKHPDMGTSVLMLAGGLTLSAGLAFLGYHKLNEGKRSVPVTATQFPGGAGTGSWDVKPAPPSGDNSGGTPWNDVK